MEKFFYSCRVRSVEHVSLSSDAEASLLIILFSVLLVGTREIRDNKRFFLGGGGGGGGGG